MLPDDHPDRIHVAFDDRRLVANAGLILPATLGWHLDLPELVDRRLDLGDAPGRANTGAKLDFVQKLDTWPNRRTSCYGWPTEIFSCRG